MVKEKPILFCTDMVRAILEDRKGQTRRVVKGKRDKEYGGGPSRVHLFSTIRQINGIWYGCDSDGLPFINDPIQQPRKPGDVLWVRETWKPQDYQFIDGMWNCAIVYKAGGMEGRVYWPDGTDSIYERCGIWRPSIHMPREAARLFLRVTDVRAERVQNISPEDCESEGYFEAEPVEPRPRSWFSAVWNACNAKRGYGWDSNPWVWVYTFERITKEEVEG